MDANIMETKMPKADGKEFSFLSEDHINTSYLETFEFDSKNQYIETTTSIILLAFEMLESIKKQQPNAFMTI